MDLRQGKIITYADDSMLLFHGVTWNEIQNVANDGLKEISQWLKLNLLSINTSKTKYMSFSINNNQPNYLLQLKIHRPTCNVDDLCTCDNLNQTSELKYLGIILNKNFKKTTHIKLKT